MLDYLLETDSHEECKWTTTTGAPGLDWVADRVNHEETLHKGVPDEREVAKASVGKASLHCLDNTISQMIEVVSLWDAISEVGAEHLSGLLILWVTNIDAAHWLTAELL